MSRRHYILPLSKRTGVLAGALSLGAFVFYSYTAAPDLTLVDSSELALACSIGGVAHPPGFPLYLLMGRLCGTIFSGSEPRCLNLMSSLFVAFSVGSLFVVGERLLAVVATPTKCADRYRYGASIVGALTFMTSLNPWSWSGITEVYSLNLVLLTTSWASAWIVVGILGLKSGQPRSISELERASHSQCSVWLFISLIMASLGLANHHATALLWLPILIFMLIIVRRPLLRDIRFFGATLTSIVLSLSIYFYLPIAAKTDPGLGWGGIRSLSLMIRHVIGEQYQSQLGYGAESLEVASQFFWMLLIGCGLPAALLLAIGVLGSFSKLGCSDARLLAIGVPTALIGLNFLLSTSYIAGPEDRIAYDLPATTAWCLLVTVGTWITLSFVQKGAVLLWASVLGMVTVGWNLTMNFDICNLRYEKTARIFVQEMLDQVPDGSVVLTSEWNFYAPFLYMRQLENYRPQIKVIDVLLMRRFWYLDYLERTMPKLIAESRQDFDKFRREVTGFDLGRHYDHSRIQEFYNNLVRRWIEIGISGGGAFTDWSCLERPQERSWIQGLKIKPEGLLLCLAGDACSGVGLVEPKDGVNLDYLRSKLKLDVNTGEFVPLLGRHDSYRKVWTNYQKAVEASLIQGIEEGADLELRKRSQTYRRWHPEIDLLLKRVEQRYQRLP